MRCRPVGDNQLTAGLRGAAQVHDELVFEAREAEAERAIVVIKRTMEGAAEPAVALTVPLVVDAGCGELGRGALRGRTTSFSPLSSRSDF
ncbi:MAG: DNA polymerase [Brevundimonas sp.]|nr:DNA polymerase [Brevundimonas sp.]MDI1327786.1 DNA polymerase [Brevundimonas sp.]